VPALYIDADGCPVKDECYRVAERHGLNVFVVSNHGTRVPGDPRIRNIAVGEGLDRADDWIAQHIGKGDVAVTSDVPLASRCVKQGARVIAPDGRAFTPASIGNDLATRNLMTALRETGAIRGGGRPFTAKDRSRFLQALEAAVQAVIRAG